ncbi:MAG: hypothetical protein LBE62_02445 [Azonexus sp.]|jgi:hypothetical protein|nr:hypothetical protein [Azonexus sp.]
MTIQVDFWVLVNILLAFFGFAFAVWKVLDRKQDARFANMEAARMAGGEHWDSRFNALEAAQKAASAELARRVEIAEALRVDVAKIMGSRENAPDVSKVYDRINEVADEVARVAGEMSALQRSVNRVENFLLNRKGDEA